MGDIRWIGRNEEDRRPEDAAGYVSEVADDSEAILVVAMRRDGPVCMRAFGDFTVEKSALVSVLLAHQVGHQMYEDVE